MLSNKDFILSNRYNRVFHDLTLAEVYSRIRNVTKITELCALFNAREEGASETEVGSGFRDTKYFKVSLLHLAVAGFDTIECPG